MAIPSTHPVFYRVVSGGHSDLFVLSREFGGGVETPRTVIGVEAVRAAGRFLSLTAGESKWRVVIVDAVDELNANGANALLKMLEEPPPGTIILLVSHVPGRLPATVRSRCCRLPLNALAEPVMRELTARLLPGNDADDQKGLMVLAEGSIGRAVEIAEGRGLDLFREILRLVSRLPALDIPELHAFGDRLARREAEAAWRTAMHLWLWWITRIVKAGTTTTPPILAGASITQGEAEIARALIARAGLERLVEVWEKSAALIAQAEGVNLDRKQVVIGVFHQLQTAVRG